MANFCSKCGTAIDQNTGLCPNCDRDRLNQLLAEQKNPTALKFCNLCGSRLSDETGECMNSLCPGKAPLPVPEEPVAETYYPENNQDYNQNFGRNYNRNQFQQEEPFQNPVPSWMTQEVTEEPQTPQVEEKPKKAKKSGSKAVTTIVTILLSICLFISFLSAVLIYDVRSSMKEENLLHLLSGIEVDVEEILDTVDVNNEVKLDGFYNYMEDEHYADISNKKMNRFIENSAVKEYVAETLAEFFEDFYDGFGSLKFSNDMAYDLVQENKSTIEKSFNVDLDKDDMKDIAEWIYSDKEDLVLINSTIIEEEAPAVYYGATIGFSYGALIVMLLLSALYIYLMFRNSWSQATCSIGIIFIIVGLPITLGAAMAAWIPSLWEVLVGDSLISMVIGSYVRVIGLVHAIVLGIGVAMLVVRGIIRKIMNKKQAKAA